MGYFYLALFLASFLATQRIMLVRDLTGRDDAIFFHIYLLLSMFNAGMAIWSFA